MSDYEYVDHDPDCVGDANDSGFGADGNYSDYDGDETDSDYDYDGNDFLEDWDYDVDWIPSHFPLVEHE